MNFDNFYAKIFLITEDVIGLRQNETMFVLLVEMVDIFVYDMPNKENSEVKTMSVETMIDSIIRMIRTANRDTLEFIYFYLLHSK